MSFVKVGKIVDSLAVFTGDPSAFAASVVIEKIQRELPRLLGNVGAQNVCPDKYKDGLLIFSVTSSVWAHEIFLKKRILIREINLLFEKPVVEKITTRIVSHISNSTEEDLQSSSDPHFE